MPVSNSALTSTPDTLQEATIPDIEVNESKRILERKKYLWVVNVFKEISTMTMTKHILELKVNLTIGELLASTLAIKK